jgi:hypothetical protein
MASPSFSAEFTMDHFYNGEPFVYVHLHEENLLSMDYFHNGEPFISSNQMDIAQNIKTVNTASFWSRVKKFGGKLIPGINKINKTEP